MEPRTAAPPEPDHEAVEFVRFCYRRRRVGWPELYDEMWAVAGRGLFRGYGTEDLGGIGIGFSLFDMPALAGLTRRIVAEEQAMRRPVTVMIAALPDDRSDERSEPVRAAEAAAPEPAVGSGPAVAPEPVAPEPVAPGQQSRREPDRADRPAPMVRLQPVTATS